MSPQYVFFELLRMALDQAEAKHGYPGKAIAAWFRVAQIVIGGNSAFTVVPDPDAQIEQYIREVYDGVKMPVGNCIALAERG